MWLQGRVEDVRRPRLAQQSPAFLLCSKIKCMQCALVLGKEFLGIWHRGKMHTDNKTEEKKKKNKKKNNVDNNKKNALFVFGCVSKCDIAPMPVSMHAVGTRMP